VKEIFYISNLISFSRFILLAVTAHFLLQENYPFAIGFLVLIWISDLLDGYFARTRNEISELGKIIDPLADKVTITVIILILLLLGAVPVWFVILTILRDVIIFCGGLYLKYRKNIVLQSNWTGKLTVFFIGSTLLIIMVIRWLSISYPAYHIEFVELFSKIFILISIVLAFISLITYARRFREELK
jgi:cardiolipin synthase